MEMFGQSAFQRWRTAMLEAYQPSARLLAKQTNPPPKKKKKTGSGGVFQRCGVGEARRDEAQVSNSVIFPCSSQKLRVSNASANQFFFFFIYSLNKESNI